MFNLFCIIWLTAAYGFLYDSESVVLNKLMTLKWLIYVHKNVASRNFCGWRTSDWCLGNTRLWLNGLSNSDTSQLWYPKPENMSLRPALIGEPVYSSQTLLQSLSNNVICPLINCPEYNGLSYFVSNTMAKLHHGWSSISQLFQRMNFRHHCTEKELGDQAPEQQWSRHHHLDSHCLPC